MNIKTKFDLKETVKIVPIDNAPGRVSSIWIGDTGEQYKVRYFHNGEAKEEYFYESELAKEPKR